MKYRDDSPNRKPAGKRLLTTTELFGKKAALAVELADIGVEAALARKAGRKDLLNNLLVQASEIRRRLAVVGVRLAERIVSVR